VGLCDSIDVGKVDGNIFSKVLWVPDGMVLGKYDGAKLGTLLGTSDGAFDR